MITWKDITVHQFQQIYKLSFEKELDDIERVQRIISIVFDKTNFEVGELSVLKFNEYAKQCGFLLTDEVQGKPQRIIKVGLKKYGVNYNPAKLKQRQYVEIITYANEPIENMHKIMASLVQPVKGWFWKKNDVEKHEAVAEKLLQAKIIDVYHTCIFFCKLYASSIAAMIPYLEKELKAKGITTEAAVTLLQNLISVSDGIIPQKKLRISRA